MVTPTLSDYTASMAERVWQSEAEQLLNDRFGTFCRSLPQLTGSGALRIAPSLSPTEAEFFVRGVEEGLFEVDGEGRVRSAVLSLVITDEESPPFQLFTHEPAPPRLRREAILQLSTAATLILDRGWLPRQIELKPPAPGYNLARDVDILVNLSRGDLVAGVVMKRTAHELDKLNRDLRQCGKRGRHPLDNCGFPQNHATYEFCVNERPLYLWAVAPDGQICLRLEYAQNGTIEIQQFESLPPRSLLELA